MRQFRDVVDDKILTDSYSLTVMEFRPLQLGISHAIGRKEIHSFTLAPVSLRGYLRTADVVARRIPVIMKSHTLTGSVGGWDFAMDVIRGV